MKAKFGAIVVDGRGKLGGHVFSKNREGSYIRTKVSPVNPQTTYQQQARSLLANFSQGWRALTESQRNAWEAAVDNWKTTNVFADIVKPTGKNLYTKLNINLQNIGASSIVNPPLPEDVVEPVITDIVLEDVLMQVTIEESTSVSGQELLIFATEPVSPGKNFVKNLYRMLGVATVGTGGIIDFAAMYTARFGAPPVGQKVCVKLVPVVNATGQKGVGASSCAIKTA